MKFTKMCGAGNDFIILENFDEKWTEDELSALAKKLCQRHFSVGADGMMVLQKPLAGGDCRMLFFNNDGSLAEMCGNGARCLCRYCVERGLSKGNPKIETAAGMVTGERISENQYRIELNTPSCIELDKKTEKDPFDYLVLGEDGIPHAVISVNFYTPIDKLREKARGLRNHPALPKGANVNCFDLWAENEIRLMTYERGVEDFTLACGTGAGATVAALTLRGLVSGKGTRVHTQGGVLTVDVLEEGQYPRIFLTGPAEITYEGFLPEE